MGKKPIEIPITEKDILEQEDIDWSDQEKHAVLYKILMQEAEKYLSLGEVKKTFAIYDRALTIVAFSQRPMLIDKINELFSNVDIFVLGHQPQSEGWSRAGKNLLIISSDHNHGCLLCVKPAESYSIEELIEAIVPLASIV